MLKDDYEYNMNQYLHAVGERENQQADTSGNIQQSSDRKAYNDEFELYYRSKLERIIESLKDKLI